MPPLAEPRAFFATPETAEALSRATSAAILVGSYDGSGNYGDIAQLDATLDLLRRHNPDLPALPVLERAHLASHRELRDEFRHPFGHTLFFAPGESHEDDLVPVLPPDRLALATCFLYGGGYLNPSWGPRKLAMLGAAEELLAACGAPPCRLSSGLQVDREWIAGLGIDDARALRRFDLLGGRDGSSVEALATVGADAQVLDTGDDAVGVLRHVPSAPAGPRGGELRINVHFAEHEWVTGRPGEGAAFFAELLAELGRRAGPPVVAQPLIAYLDRRVDERPGVERLAAECAVRGVELAEPLVLRPASLADAASVVRRAALTLSCSYHVALTSLLLETPAALLAANPYYRQKAAGLTDSFGLPPAFELDPGSDPAAVAAALAREALDEQQGEALRERLAAGAERARGRRAAAEEELLGRLAATRKRVEHEVTDVEHGDGELSFTARIGGREQRVWMRADADRPTSAEAVLPATLMPAMRFGGTLTLPVPVSPRVLRTQPEFQGIQRAWSRQWALDTPPLAEVEVRAPTAVADERPEARGRVAAFFSGGVDSWSVVLDEPDLTDLIFVRGFDLLAGNPHQADLIGEVEHRLGAVADELGLGFHAVETNLRELTDPHIGWEAVHGCVADALAHFLAPRFERVLIAGANDHENQAPMGVSRLVDQLWSSERLELAQAGGRYSRVERIRRIADHPLVQRTLRVCWENREGAYNCGRCRKCLYTMVALETLGVRDAIETFPPQLDVDLLAAAQINHRTELVLYEDLLDEIRARGRLDLVPPVARLVARGKRKLGLPLSHRSRATPGPPPLRGSAGARRAG
jgi:polysaccharide pyruvyl transferase WcaK-like protein